ncbi:MAG: P-loop NTPase fold protein [Pseudomonadota bacterium]
MISIDNPGYKDVLGRVAFSRHLLDLAERVDVESNSATIGLEGAWGTGKTHVLKSLKSLIDERQEDQRPILIQFNPWMVSGTHGLVEAFLLQMAADLSPKKEGVFRRFKDRLSNNVSRTAILAASLIDYASILGTVKYFAPAANMILPGSGHCLDMIGSAAESTAKILTPAKGRLARLMKHPNKLSLSDSREKIKTLLNELGRRVIVVVDDLDRLPPTELMSMLQAIKVVSDFPNIIYILAYDPAIAAKAVNTALSISDGEAFLEKIIQLPLRLPEAPAGKFNIFAIDRLKSSVNIVEISDQAQQDLTEAWPYIAALMVTPRDVERLRTRLLVGIPVMQDQVNIADVILLEALSLKAPKVMGWISNNIRVIISINLAQYDNDLELRGKIGDSMEDLTSATEDKQKRNEKRPFEWEVLLQPDQQLKLSVKNAMAYLFDKCKPRWSSAPKRSNFRRVQEYRFWYRWCCYHDHHERWTAPEIDGFLREPKRILEAGLHRDADGFRGFCQQTCDIGLNSLQHAESIAFVNVYQQAEEKLGTDLMMNWELGFGPVDALVLTLRLDHPDNRVRTLELLIGQVSIWLSGRIILKAWKEIFAPEEEVHVVRHLVPNSDDLAPILEKWYACADESLAAASETTFSFELKPYTLLTWMNIMKRDIGLIQQAGAKFIQGDPSRLAVFFADFADQTKDSPFPSKVIWNILPDAKELMSLATRSPSFLQTHSKFVTELRQRNSLQ